MVEGLAQLEARMARIGKIYRLLDDPEVPAIQKAILEAELSNLKG